MKVTINKETGLGEAYNPYPRNIDLEYNEMWKDFAKDNPPLPVISASGEQLTSGTWEVEKVWQIYDVDFNGWFETKVQELNKNKEKQTRQVYRVITKNMEEQKHKKKKSVADMTFDELLITRAIIDGLKNDAVRHQNFQMASEHRMRQVKVETEILKRFEEQFDI